MPPSKSFPNSSEFSQPAYYTSSEIARRPLDTKWLEGSENTVKATVVELKRLLNMELHDSIEFSQSLTEAVFPDYNLPIRIDDDLLNGPRATRRQTQTRRSPKSVLSRPPEDWSEANTCQWLNDIGDTLRQAKLDANYTNNNGQVATPSKRIWSSAYSSVFMKHSNKHNPVPLRKPDIILIDDDFNGDISWPQVHALAEVTRTELIKSRTIKDTVYQKSYVMFRSQDNRSFVPSLYFTGEGFFTFNVCDRSGIVYTTTLEIADHPLILLRILTGLMFGRPSVVGYDETVQCDSLGRAVLIRVGGLDYRVKAELFKSTALRGRATRCWSVESVDERKEGFVLKDCWADVRREQSEIVILKLIRELGLCESHYVPRLVHGENVPILLNVMMGLYGDDCTARRRGEDSSVEGRVHRRLLMKPLGRHLTDFRCLHELVGAVIDAVEAHRALYSNGILHRDISVNNIMIIPCGNSGTRPDENVHWDHGLLIDYDYSFLYAWTVKEIALRLAKEGRDDLAALVEIITEKDPQGMDIDNEVLLHRTGTLPFMSIQLLTAGPAKIEHSEKHDLESFFWVLLYICTMFEGPGQRRINGQRNDPQHPFGHWLGKMDHLEEVGKNVTAYGIGSFRNTALVHHGGPKDLLERFVDPHFKPLIPMLEALCDKVFLIVKHNNDDETPMRMPTVADGDYDGVLDILKNTLKELPAHGPLPPPPSGEVNRDTAIMPPPPGLLKIGQRKSEPMTWGSDSGYGGGETSHSGSLRGRRAVASTGDVGFVDGKKRRNNSSPNKTTAARRSTSSPTKHASRSSTKRSNDQHIIEGTSSSSSKRHKAGQV